MNRPRTRGFYKSAWHSRRRAWGLMIRPYALTALCAALLGWFTVGGFEEVGLLLLYIAMLASVIFLGAHLITFGWLSPSHPDFAGLCREMQASPLSHEQHRGIREAAQRDPAIGLRVLRLQREGRAWDNQLAEECRRLNIRHRK